MAACSNRANRGDHALRQTTGVVYQQDVLCNSHPTTLSVHSSQLAVVSVPYHQAMRRLDVSLDFPQRALGFGEAGDPQTVDVFPEALPDELPFKRPCSPDCG